MDRWDRLAISDATQRPILLDDEAELLLVPKIALYEGERLLENYQEGSLTITNHRLLWRDAQRPLENSVSLSLSLINEAIQKAGFLTSSPKVILKLLPKNMQSHYHPKRPLCGAPTKKPGTWQCNICEETNTTELVKCSACGVSKQKNAEETIEKGFADSWDCHICTLTNKVTLQTCDACGSPRKLPLKKDHALSSLPSEMPDSVASMKLSFRGGTGTSNFYAHLQVALQKQDWKVRDTINVERTFDSAAAGISGLLHKAKITETTADVNLNVAFDDLDALMSKASDMVKLAESISAKLSSKEEAVDDELESEFKKMLGELSLSSAVTKEMAGSAFSLELARQLGEFVVKLLERRKAHVISLADVYCLYNRARGSNLVSPNDLYEAAITCDHLSLPITLKKLDSGLLVFQLCTCGQDPIHLRIISLLQTQLDNIDALQLSRFENIPLSMALMYLHSAEREGIVCKDLSPTGTIQYYRNLILEDGSV